MRYLVSYSYSRPSSENSADYFCSPTFDDTIRVLYSRLGLEPSCHWRVGEMVLLLSPISNFIPELELNWGGLDAFQYAVVSSTGIVDRMGTRALFFVVSSVESVSSPRKAACPERGLTWRNTDRLIWKSELVDGIDEVRGSCLSYWSEFFPLQAISALQWIEQK